MTDTETLDWVVGEVLDAVGLRPQPDAAAMAALLGLELWPQRRRGALLESTRVYYDDDASDAQQQSLIAACVARWALAWCDVAVDEVAVDYVARAITNRRQPFSFAERASGVVVLFPEGGRRASFRAQEHRP